MKDKRQIAVMAVGVMEVAAFAAFAAWILTARNSDTLYQAQNFSFFSSSTTFFAECMKQPGGLISWVASYLTQLLYNPAEGAAALILLWLAAFFVSRKALGVSAVWTGALLVPLFALLTSIVDNGYWLYYIKQQGFWFYATVGYLTAMTMTLIATWGSRLMPDRLRIYYRLAATLATALTYPLFGIYSLMALVYTRCAETAEDLSGGATGRRWRKSVSITTAFTALLALFIPRIAYNHYTEIRLDDIYTVGLPVFAENDMVSSFPQQPIVIMLAAPIVIALIARITPTKGKWQTAVCGVNIGIVALCAYMTWQRDFQDHNYHAEIRMYKAMENQQWDEALAEMDYLPGDPDRQMILTKNIALMNKGEICTKMFAYPNRGSNVRNDFDTLLVRMVQTAAPMIYMHHGRTHFATRWCIENSVEYGYSFNNLKILTQCALVNGESDLARKYLTILKTSMNYRDWAERYWPITENPALIKDYPEFATIRELHGSYESVLDTDTGLCEIYLQKTFSEGMSKDSRLYNDMCLIYAMVTQDIDLFWPRFFQYAEMHKGEDMPLPLQQAAFLYGSLENKVDISQMPFDKEKVADRYQQFQQVTQQYVAQGMNEEAIADMTSQQFGDSFYWFYFFCRNLKSY
ncbi:MAG: hypothetical protein HUK08_07320 [Bacteroidaceae bacterium]|nr:hypothetical protein [Bacteroidaceae bacterium]